MKITAIVTVMMLSTVSTCYAQINLRAIAQIESSGNAQAVSYRGAKYGRGLHQVSEVCLKEYNSYNNASYSPCELFTQEINSKVASWYLERRIPQMLRHYKIEDTVRNRLICYNFGIGNLRRGRELPEETRRYIQKYNRLAKEIETDWNATKQTQRGV